MMRSGNNLVSRFTNLNRPYSSTKFSRTCVAHMASSSVEADKRAGEEVESAKPPATGIRRLLLTGNHLGEQGARALASAVRKDRSLEVLDLTRCALDGLDSAI